MTSGRLPILRSGELIRALMHWGSSGLANRQAATNVIAILTGQNHGTSPQRQDHRARSIAKILKDVGITAEELLKNL